MNLVFFDLKFFDFFLIYLFIFVVVKMMFCVIYWGRYGVCNKVNKINRFVFVLLNVVFG